MRPERGGRRREAARRDRRAGGGAGAGGAAGPVGLAARAAAGRGRSPLAPPPALIQFSIFLIFFVLCIQKVFF